jgi:hypothetical protein
MARQMDGYASQINAGSLTFGQAAKDYYMSIKDQPDVLSKAYYKPVRCQAMLKRISYFLFGLLNSEDVFVMAMKNGEAKIHVEYEPDNKYGMQECCLYLRNDTKGKTDAQIDELQKEEHIITERDEYGDNEYIRQQADQLTGVTVNQKVIDKYSPKMFRDARE